MKKLIPDHEGGENMEERTCRTCHQSYPLTPEFFHTRKYRKGVIGFYTQCKPCRNQETSFGYRKRKVKQEEEAKNQWMEALKDKIFKCKICGLDKTFDEMKYGGNQKLKNMCKVCAYRLRKEVYEPNYKANVFEKVLKERKKLNEGE
jgi:transcription elongation factor Elf1